MTAHPRLPRPENPIAVALDTADLDHLGGLAATLGPRAGMLKVGLEAFAAHGPEAVRTAAAHGQVFYDAKLHDIPNQVAGAAAALARLGVGHLTVHAAGGRAMIAAATAAAPQVSVLAVTVLTSLDDASLAEIGQDTAAAQVPRLAAMAVSAGAAGIVCAPSEVGVVRAAIGDDPLVVTPGIRPTGTATDDQARVATPRAAISAGADVLVIGRPITRATDPAAAADAILADLQRTSA